MAVNMQGNGTMELRAAQLLTIQSEKDRDRPQTSTQQNPTSKPVQHNVPSSPNLEPCFEASSTSKHPWAEIEWLCMQHGRTFCRVGLKASEQFTTD